MKMLYIIIVHSACVRAYVLYTCTQKKLTEVHVCKIVGIKDR